MRYLTARTTAKHRRKNAEETLTVEAQAEPLAYYTVRVNRRGHLTTVTEPRLLPTRHQARQPRLALRVPARGPRQRKPRSQAVQGRLTEPADTG